MFKILARSRSIRGDVPYRSAATGQARQEINRPGQHQQARCDEFLASPATSSEPATGNHAGAFAEVAAALSYLAEMINQRLQCGPFRG
jgi:hypothetical protein